MSEETQDHNVYILGAGFSRDAGAPLIHDFLDRARELYADPDADLDVAERGQFERVFKFKREIAKAREKFRIDLDNIEQLFGLVEMSQRLGLESTLTRDATVYLIAKTLQLALASNSRRPVVTFGLATEYAAHASFIDYVGRQSGGDRFTTDIYTHFALLLSGRYDDQRRLSSRPNTVITFNYDLIVDDALGLVNAKPDYALSGAIFEEPSQSETVVPVLKLHGSTNWAICECKKIHVLGRKATAIPEFKSKRCSQCQRTGLRLLLVPPSWDKSEYSEIMKPVWKRAVDAIKTATRICVVGYSMPETDAFFKFLLALGLAENDRLYKLIVVDRLQGPSPQENNTIDLRWKGMLESLFVDRRFVFFPHGFAQFVSGSIQHLLRRGEQITA